MDNINSAITLDESQNNSVLEAEESLEQVTSTIDFLNHVLTVQGNVDTQLILPPNARFGLYTILGDINEKIHKNLEVLVTNRISRELK